MRKLASVQVVTDILPIEGADRIELAKVLGWQCVTLKNEFKKGDLAVYFEVDSFLPVCDKFEFLRKTSYKKSNLMGEGFRLRTMKMRGEISQGLLQPISVLPEGDWLITLPCSTESLYDCFTDTLNPADSSSDDAST